MIKILFIYSFFIYNLFALTQFNIINNQECYLSIKINKGFNNLYNQGRCPSLEDLNKDLKNEFVIENYHFENTKPYMASLDISTNEISYTGYSSEYLQEIEKLKHKYKTIFDKLLSTNANSMEEYINNNFTLLEKEKYNNYLIEKEDIDENFNVIYYKVKKSFENIYYDFPDMKPVKFNDKKYFIIKKSYHKMFAKDIGESLYVYLKKSDEPTREEYYKRLKIIKETIEKKEQKEDN